MVQPLMRLQGLTKAYPGVVGQLPRCSFASLERDTRCMSLFCCEKRGGQVLTSSRSTMPGAAPKAAQ